MEGMTSVWICRKPSSVLSILRRAEASDALCLCVPGPPVDGMKLHTTCSEGFCDETLAHDSKFTCLQLTTFSSSPRFIHDTVASICTLCPHIIHIQMY